MFKSIFFISFFLFFISAAINAQEKKPAVYRAPHSASEKLQIVESPDTSKPLKANTAATGASENNSQIISTGNTTSKDTARPISPATKAEDKPGQAPKH